MRQTMSGAAPLSCRVRTTRDSARPTGSGRGPATTTTPSPMVHRSKVTLFTTGRLSLVAQ